VNGQFSQEVGREFRAIGRSLGHQLLLAAFALWMAAPAVIHIFKRLDGDAARRSQSLLLLDAYDLGVAKHLLFCPMGLALAAFSVFSLLPVFTLVLVLANRRAPEAPGAFFGRGAALWLAWSLALGVTYSVVGVTQIGVAHYPATVVLSWTFVLFVWSALLAAVNVSLWTLLHACFTRRLALLPVAAVVLLMLSAARSWLRLKDSPAAGLLPNGLEGLLLSGRTDLALRGVLAALAWCATTLTAAFFVVKPRASAKAPSPREAAAPSARASTEAA
jgi:hypothetical protein